MLFMLLRYTTYVVITNLNLQVQFITVYVYNRFSLSTHRYVTVQLTFLVTMPEGDRRWSGLLRSYHRRRLYLWLQLAQCRYLGILLVLGCHQLVFLLDKILLQHQIYKLLKASLTLTTLGTHWRFLRSFWCQNHKHIISGL